jgi:uncharacterized protein
MLDKTGLQFEQAVPAPSTVPNRADVACFIGFVPRSQKFLDALPASLSQWLRAQGLVNVPAAPPELDTSGALTPRVRDLLQLPVPIDSWSTFTNLFDWRGRPLDPEVFDTGGLPLAAAPGTGICYLGAAVRSFFAQGGRKCFVVRVGDPVALTTTREERLALIGALLPEWAGDLAAQSPEAPERWLGIAHLFGLSEASFVCLPDLPWLVAQELPPPELDPPLPARREFFVECSELEELEPLTITQATGAPRLADAQGYREWARALNLAGRFIGSTTAARSRKDVQLVAAIPLPLNGSDADADLLSTLLNARVLERLDNDSSGVSSAHVQLAYPWISWQGSADLPEGLEPPDGALVGLLARCTLLEGAFTSFADQGLRHVNRLEPELSLAQMASVRRRNLESSESGDQRFLSLRQRVSLFGFTVDGIELLADVTTSADDAWRPANVNRLMSVWVRALQRAGEDFEFEPSNELLWADVRHRLQFVGESLFRSGALNGRSPQEAFEVRCDRSTMTLSDLDGGRLVAEVRFRPAIPIEGIVIALGLHEAQRISVRQVA